MLTPWCRIWLMIQAVKPGYMQPIVRRTRYDALPEGADWRDDGCEVAPHCLECPLERCRYEAPGGLRGLLNSTVRDPQIIILRAEGASIHTIAKRFGLSRRSVWRALVKA